MHKKMKNFFFILAFCCLGSIGAIAQSTTKVVTGAVIDKNGNPLPGAIVEATGGAESTVVDADGTFSIEVPIWLKSLTTRYAGMKSKKKNLNGRDMIFLLRPDTDSWFINLETSVNADVYRIGAGNFWLLTFTEFSSSISSTVRDINSLAASLGDGNWLVGRDLRCSIYSSVASRTT